MKKDIIKFIIIFFSILILDQITKILILNGIRFDSECISLILVFNKGVAFSMFAFLEEYLKYIQLILILGVTIYFFSHKDYVKEYTIGAAIILGAGISNLLDRFIHEGVVDYVYWHCWFDFAVFNFADVMIDLGVLLILLKSFKLSRKASDL